MKGLIIIGAGGHGRVVADIALRTNRWEYIYFLDDDEALKYSMGIEVIGKNSEAFNLIDSYDIFVAIGNNKIRSKIQEQLKTAGACIPVLMHPNATVGEQVRIGNGTVLMAGVVINCGTRIGNGCIINTGATVDHDCVIEDYCHISPGTHIAGTVNIGMETWLGIGVCVSNNVYITSECKIGAGAAVVKDINEAGTYVGVPARRVLG